MENKDELAKLLAPLFLQPSQGLKLIAKFKKGRDLVINGNLKFSQGNYGILRVYDYEVPILEARPYTIYTGKNLNQYDPAKLKHGLRLWLNPTGTISNWKLLAIRSKGRGYFVEYQLTKNLDDVIRYTDAVYKIKTKDLANAIIQQNKRQN